MLALEPRQWVQGSPWSQGGPEALFLCLQVSALVLGCGKWIFSLFFLIRGGRGQWPYYQVIKHDGSELLKEEPTWRDMVWCFLITTPPPVTQEENFIKQVTGFVSSWPGLGGLVKYYEPSHIKVYNYPTEYLLEPIEFVYNCISPFFLKRSIIQEKTFWIHERKE